MFASIGVLLTLMLKKRGNDGSIKVGIPFLKVQCIPYFRSLELKALIMGDAAHATIPAIGQGMNTALADARVLNDLLDEHKDDWTVVLPKFSDLRVKEGDALADLSFYAYSSSGMQQMKIMARQQFDER